MDTLYEWAEKAKTYYNENNKAVFTDSMDVVVIRHADGTLKSSPFYVRFGKIGVLKPKEKVVAIEVNDILIDEISMKLDDCGEAFFTDKTLEESLSSTNDSSINLNYQYNSNSQSIHSASEPNIKQNDSSRFDTYLKAAKTLKDFFVTNSIISTESEENNSEAVPQFYIETSESSQSIENKIQENILGVSRPSWKRSPKDSLNKQINLSSDKLKLLNLQPGVNEIKFTVLNSPKGMKSTKACIYLWDSNDKIVISDIDGTITKSDLRGHIMSFLGRDWYQDGVVNLFNSISNNGYKIIYLSARPICQCELTRNLIQNLTQNSRSLPDGAVLVNPADFLIAFHAELILKNPDEFKISCLENIRALFTEEPSDLSPFFAGFGNKPSDVIAYKGIGLEEESIFIINPLGEISGNPLIKNLSYPLLNKLCNQFFPSLN